jgi:hypothetical protein
MILSNARNVCQKINENVADAFLFEAPSSKWEERVDAFIEKFSEKYGLDANTVAARSWSFSNKEHGQFNDGVIELDLNDTKPVFKFRDVSEAKITDNSPDFNNDLRAAKSRINDAKIEYIGRLKAVVKTAKHSLNDLSLHFQDGSHNDQSTLELDKELQDLQKKYDVTMDRLIEIQGATEENYESLKGSVEMSLIGLKQSIENTEFKIDAKS